MKTDPHYYCTDTGCQRLRLKEDETGLHCPNGHFFPYIQGTQVPVFACEEINANEYSQENAALIHDNAFQWVFQTFKTDESTLRQNLVSRLELSKGQKVLVTGVGSGHDLPFVIQSLEGNGTIYAQDISKQMLMVGVETYKSIQTTGVNVFFSASDATNLPFADDFFDAAYHFGGLNLFSNCRQGIFEMHRVVRPEGKVLICDEGIAPWLKETELGKMLIKNNPLYAYDAPLSLLPEYAKSVKLSWELSHCFYVIEFNAAKVPPDINLDIPHIGKRGGSIRSRYLGQLEGVNPVLRDKVYAMAEKKGISRVQYLEQLLSTELD